MIFNSKALITQKFSAPNKHFGVDVIPSDGTGLGANIYAPFSGYVMYLNQPGLAGYYLRMYPNTTGEGKSYLIFCHLNYNDWKNRQNGIVEAGSIIGKMGNSGNATGAHVHLGLLLDGKYVDPLLFPEIQTYLGLTPGGQSFSQTGTGSINYTNEISQFWKGLGGIEKIFILLFGVWFVKQYIL